MAASGRTPGNHNDVIASLQHSLKSKVTTTYLDTDAAAPATPRTPTELDLKTSVLITPAAAAPIAIIDPKFLIDDYNAELAISQQAPVRLGLNESTKTIFVATNASTATIRQSLLQSEFIDIFNISDENKAKIASGETNVVPAKKHACNWKTLEYMPKSFHSFTPDSYLVIKHPKQAWEIIYLDEHNRPQRLDLDKFPALKFLSENEKNKAPNTSPQDKNLATRRNQQIEEDLAKYRKDSQKKPVNDTNNIFWLKFSPEPEILLVELFNAHLYKLLNNETPKCILCTDANGKPGFIATGDLPGYIPLSKDRLTDDDLPISIFDSNYISEEVFSAMRAYEKVCTDEYLARFKDDDKVCDIVVCTNPKTEKAITCRHFKNYLTQKRLGVSITNSYQRDENDLTKNNLGKRGRIDYDLSLHRVASKYKKPKYVVDNKVRAPTETTYKKTWGDMQSLPILTDAQPWYFPGNKNTVAKLTNKNDNAYSDDENRVFALLSTKPVFEYHKLKSFLKDIITPKEMYQYIADTTIPSEFNTLKIELVTEAMKIKEDIYHEVLKWEVFSRKLITYGKNWLDEILEEFEVYNADIKHPEHKIKREDVIAKYNAFYAQVTAAMQARESTIAVKKDEPSMIGSAFGAISKLNPWKRP